MESAECAYDGCKNKGQHQATGLCTPHRRMQLRGESLRPLRPKSRLQSPTCTGPQCVRPSEAHDLCKQHGQQLRNNGRLHVIGDPTHRARLQRERWERTDPDERAKWVAKMVANQPKVRSEETIRRQADAARKAWTRKFEQAPDYTRACLTCGTDFTVKRTPGARQFYCTVDCRRLYARLRRHGLTYQRYQEILDAQGGMCALCEGPWRGWSGQNGHIDHDHKTGRVRGLLCGDCNTAIGRFGDDPVRLRRAAEYLERSDSTAL